MTNALVLDFDGVVLPRSEFVKQQAWPRVFAEYGDAYRPFFKAAESKFGSGRGGDRYDILRETYRGLGVPEHLLHDAVAKGALQFDEYVQSRILNEGIAADTVHTLSELAQRVPLYLNSATPTDALVRTVSALGIDSFFREVLGRPNNKIQNFELVTRRESCAPADILFAGDSDSDFTAAQTFGCLFVGVANDWNTWDADKPFPVIRSLDELYAHVG